MANGNNKTTTPLGVLVEEQNPDQAKMAGTPAQKQGALGMQAGTLLGVRPKKAPSLKQPKLEDTLAFTKRVHQPRPSDTERANAKELLEQNQQLARLGNLGEQLKGVISTNIDKLYDEQDKAAADMLLPQIEESPEKRQEVQDLLTDIGQDTDELSRREKIKELHGVLGKEPGDLLSVSDIQALYPNPNEAIANVVATSLADEVQVDSDILEGLGYSSDEFADLADALGVHPGQLTQMSVNEFQKAVDKQTRQQIARVESAKARLAKADTPAAVREQIRSDLIEMGYSGELAASERSQDLLMDVEEADKNIEIGGRVFDTLKDALSDEAVSGMVRDYLADPDSEFSKDLPEGLKAIVDQNKETLLEVTDQLDDELKDFADLQSRARSVGEIGPGISLDQELVKELFPDYGEFVTKDVDLSVSPALAKMREEGATPESINTTNTVNVIAARYGKDEAMKILRMTPEQLQKMDFGNEMGVHRQYMDSLEFDKNLQEAKDIDAVMGLFHDEADLDEIIENLEEAADLGDTDSEEKLRQLGAIFDPAGDGLETSTLEELQLIKNKMGRVNEGFRQDLGEWFVDEYAQKFDELKLQDLGAVVLENLQNIDKIDTLRQYVGRFPEITPQIEERIKQVVNTEASKISDLDPKVYQAGSVKPVEPGTDANRVSIINLLEDSSTRAVPEVADEMKKRMSQIIQPMVNQHRVSREEARQFWGVDSREQLLGVNQHNFNVLKNDFGKVFQWTGPGGKLQIKGTDITTGLDLNDFYRSFYVFLKEKGAGGGVNVANEASLREYADRLRQYVEGGGKI